MDVRGLLGGASENPHRLEPETRLRRRDAWKPKQGFALGPCGLTGTIYCLLGHPSASQSRGRCCACIRWPTGVQGSLQDRDGLGDLGDFSYSVGLWPMEWAEFPWTGQAETCGVAPGASAWRGVGQGCGERIAKTQSALGLWPMLWQWRCTSLEGRSSAYGRRVRGRRLLRLQTWILVQGWPWNSGEASWALDESPSLGNFPHSQEFGVILGEGKSPVFCLTCHSKTWVSE